MSVWTVRVKLCEICSKNVTFMLFHGNVIAALQGQNVPKFAVCGNKVLTLCADLDLAQLTAIWRKSNNYPIRNVSPKFSRNESGEAAGRQVAPYGA